MLELLDFKPNTYKKICVASLVIITKEFKWKTFGFCIMSKELCSSQEQENEALPLEDVKIVY